MLATRIHQRVFDDTAIAVVSVNNTTLAISGIAEGTTTITVSATDDSEKNNTAATPLTFQVTVLLNNTVPRRSSVQHACGSFGQW